MLSHRMRAILSGVAVELSRVRNLLKLMQNTLGHLVSRVDGMIHPNAASDSFLAPLHRSFMISSFVSGAAALFVLPLHLALAGPPHAAVLLVLAWMLGQWPLALYLSRSGALDRAIGMSSALFACCVAAICLLTGGPGSFALAWLLIPLMETAFATDRKTPAVITLLCGVLLATIALLPLPEFQIAVPAAGSAIFATLGAMLYAGVLALRLTLDRMLARHVVRQAETRQNLISQATNDVICEVSSDGTLQLLGGSVSDLIGPLPFADGEDWLFPRLHVADRPLYLTHLSDARHSGKTQRFDIRFRVGASCPGEVGMADYRRLTLRFQKPEHETFAAGDSDALVLTLSGAASETPATEPAIDTSGLFTPEIAELHAAGAAPATSALSRSPETDRDQGETRAIEAGAGEIALTKHHVGCDLTASLEQCRDLLTPVAARRGILLDFAFESDLPLVKVEPKGLRQALNCILADMIETCGDGAVLMISTDLTDMMIACNVEVSGRRSAQTWRASHSKSVIDRSSDLLKEAGARLSVMRDADKDNRVTFHLPISAASGQDAQLAQSA